MKKQKADKMISSNMIFTEIMMKCNVFLVEDCVENKLVRVIIR